MTDDKLRALVAIHVFGFEQPYEITCGFKQVDGKEEFFTKFVLKDGQKILRSTFPNYLTWAGMGLVVEEMERREWHLIWSVRRRRRGR